MTNASVNKVMCLAGHSPVLIGLGKREDDTSWDANILNLWDHVDGGVTNKTGNQPGAMGLRKRYFVWFGTCSVWGPLSSRPCKFRAVAPKLRWASQRLVDWLNEAVTVGFCLAGELPWSISCTQAGASLRTGTKATKPNILWDFTANNSLLGKSKSCNFSLLLEKLEAWVMYYPQNSAHASHIVKLSPNKMVWKSVSFHKGLHSSSYWKWVFQGVKKLYALRGV